MYYPNTRQFIKVCARGRSDSVSESELVLKIRIVFTHASKKCLLSKITFTSYVAIHQYAYTVEPPIKDALR